ncbi:tetratricopeptide repeat protein [Candidatus Omnitrophota bacterium]
MFKKISVLLVLVFLIGTLSGCGSGNDQYAIERKFWYAQRQANNIIEHPFASPPQELERTVSVLKKFSNENPENPLAVRSEFLIGRLYMAKGMYDKTRDQFSQIIAKYRREDSLCSEALFYIGNSYEIDNKWNSALQQYRRIMKKYPLTQKGLDAPIYIARYYEEKHNTEKMNSAYKEAIAYYDSLAERYPDTIFGFMVSNLKAKCYVALKEWESAVRAFNVVIQGYRYKGQFAMDQILINIALIYDRQLKDKDRAKRALEKLINEYPKSRFISSATEMLEELSEDS